MKKGELMTKMSRMVHTVGFKIQKKSPEILIVVGIVGGITSAVMACVATTKAGKIVDDTKVALDDCHEAMETGMTKAGETYSEQDCKKDTTLIVVQTGIKFVKLYGPSVALGALSITSILASHNVMKKRNVAIAAAYAAIDKSFKDYRSRVMERFGEQVERELRYGIKAQEVERTVKDENGNEQQVKETVNVLPHGIDPTKYSPYARMFDETHPDWRDDRDSHDPNERNRFYLLARQSQANDMLQAKGHLFLNEVYDLLGFRRTKAGASVGWIYDLEHPIGDNFVDFGIFDIYKSKARDFVNGDEPAIMLDFNCVGDITNYIEDHQFGIGDSVV